MPRQKWRPPAPKAWCSGLRVHVEAVGVLVAGLVAVRRHVPHHHLVALADLPARPARCRGSRCGGSGRRRGTSAATPRPRSGSATGRRAGAGAGRGLRSAPACRCSRSPWCCRCRRRRAGRSPSRSRAPRASAPSTSAWTRTLVRSSVGFSRRSAISLRQRSKISGTVFSTTPSTPSGLRSGSLAPERRVHQPGPDRVVLRRDAHEAADHARDDRLGDVGDQVAGLATLEPVEHADDDLPDRLLVRRRSASA